VIRCTIFSSELADFPAKGISPDNAQTMTPEEIISQIKINESYNKVANQLGDILISKLLDTDITWCNDGCFVISCDTTMGAMETILVDDDLEIRPDRSEIKHKIKELTPGVFEEDIDEIFEPLTVGETKRLQLIPVSNPFHPTSLDSQVRK